MTSENTMDDEVGSCCPIELTATVEDYLKTILALSRSGGATTGGIAERVGVSPASASAMLTRLLRAGLVAQCGWGQVEMTGHGAAHARSILRRHRLIETYLHEMLGLAPHEVHVEAEVLEHALSPRLEELIDQALGRPDRDPHGSPIPARQTTVREPRWSR